MTVRKALNPIKEFNLPIMKLRSDGSECGLYAHEKALGRVVTQCGRTLAAIEYISLGEDEDLDLWNVTHVPTGSAVMEYFVTERDAHSAARSFWRSLKTHQKEIMQTDSESDIRDALAETGKRSVEYAKEKYGAIKALSAKIKY